MTTPKKCDEGHAAIPSLPHCISTLPMRKGVKGFNTPRGGEEMTQIEAVDIGPQTQLNTVLITAQGIQHEYGIPVASQKELRGAGPFCARDTCRRAFVFPS